MVKKKTKANKQKKPYQNNSDNKKERISNKPSGFSW